MNLPDIFRWTVITEGFVLLGWSCALLYEAQIWKSNKKYVIWISISYMLLVIENIIEIYLRLGDKYSHRSPLTAIAFTIGLFTIMGMWKHFKKQIKNNNK